MKRLQLKKDKTPRNNKYNRNLVRKGSTKTEVHSNAVLKYANVDGFSLRVYDRSDNNISELQIL